MVFITALIASVLALFYFQLSFRAQSNFAEYVPLSLLLMALLEINDAPSVLVLAIGCCLLVGLYLHAKGVSDPDQGHANRIKGLKWTFLAMALLALANIVWMGYLFIQSTRFATSVFVH